MATLDVRPLPAGAVDLHDARRRRHWSVKLEPFSIGIVPVTEAKYAQVMGDDKSSAMSPVVDLSWLDAVRFCNAASIHDGLVPVYVMDEGNVTWQTEATGYRLPTEAEWEYACRAGMTGPHYGSLDRIAWAADDQVDEPQAVGLKQPNTFGLHNTLGNAWEWCWNLLDPARYGDYRVFRGGGFADKRWSVRASTRRGGASGMKHPDVGLRVARGLFHTGQTTQGWSAQADNKRGTVRGPLPSGWTPLGK
ncbi:SUMF1/EgtB/PvdO family nonheme iron enzyme [Arthrobacter yangruifuii]|uniref:SUMF1/EgtB/PvdO family nonheme iron enzyme n=1 Tax=Arthrobacter yangruifuii TaxID=2606616 RepID=A0A5N6MGR5_9MICC|nr:SUMF1/EgtB/PvdO family nonheme iron enzyme [Arthrobacter yangruifuii]KAD3632925.1 SUMF1/EgtB/PvdO family nonheme iron enzyme [Arthrobacter yangruifuii]